MRGVACQRVLTNDFEYLMACARDRDYSSSNLLHEATGNGQKLKARRNNDQPACQPRNKKQSMDAC